MAALFEQRLALGARGIVSRIVAVRKLLGERGAIEIVHENLH